MAGMSRGRKAFNVIGGLVLIAMAVAVVAIREMKQEPVPRPASVTPPQAAPSLSTTNAPGQQPPPSDPNAPIDTKNLGASIAQELKSLSATYASEGPPGKYADLIDSGLSIDTRAILDVAEKGAENARTITYSHLKKDADRYAGKPFVFSGPILEIQEAKGQLVARINQGSYSERPIWVAATFNTEFIDGKYVDVIGYLAGSYSYTSQAGWNITIPSVFAIAMTKNGNLARARALRSGKRLRRSEDEE